LVILNALSVPTAAQTPTPATTAFDGKYVGTATLTGGGHAGEYCYPIPLCGHDDHGRASHHPRNSH